MSKPMTFECDIHFHRRGSRRHMAEGPQPTASITEPGKVPRVSRLMALAILCDALIAAGEIANYSEIATLGHVTRARVTQIMNLLNLAPDIQEEILFLPRTRTGRDIFHLRLLQPIAKEGHWNRQRRSWKEVRATAMGK